MVKIKWTRSRDGMRRARLDDGRELELYEVRGYGHLSDQPWVFDWFDLRHQFKRGPISKLVDALASAEQYAALPPAAAKKYRDSLASAAKAKELATGTLRAYAAQVRELATAFLASQGQDGDELRANVDELQEDETFVELRDEAYGDAKPPRTFVAEWFEVRERDVPVRNDADTIAKQQTAKRVDAAQTFLVDVRRLLRKHVDVDEDLDKQIPELRTVAARVLREGGSPMDVVRVIARTREDLAMRATPRCVPGSHVAGCEHQPTLPIVAEIPSGPGRLHKTETRASSPEIPPHATLRQQRVFCGKPKCTKCVGIDGLGTGGHGPYWYAAWKVGGRTRSKYIGRELPLDIARDRAVTTIDGVQVTAAFARAAAEQTSQQPPA